MFRFHDFGVWLELIWSSAADLGPFLLGLVATSAKPGMRRFDLFPFWLCMAGFLSFCVGLGTF